MQRCIIYLTGNHFAVLNWVGCDELRANRTGQSNVVALPTAFIAKQNLSYIRILQKDSTALLKIYLAD